MFKIRKKLYQNPHLDWKEILSELTKYTYHGETNTLQSFTFLEPKKKCYVNKIPLDQFGKKNYAANGSFTYMVRSGNNLQ